MSRPTGRNIAVATTVLALVGGGGAYAFIQASGTGGGTAQSAALQPVVLTASVTGLGPNDAPTPITVQYTNPNKFKVSAKFGIKVEVDPADPIPAACAGESITLADIGPTSFAADVATPTALPAGYTGGTVTWAYNEAVDQSACLTALATDSFSVKLTVKAS